MICGLYYGKKRKVPTVMKNLIGFCLIAIVATVCVLFIRKADDTEPAAKAYADFINTLEFPEEEYKYYNPKDSLHFDFGYIDGDDVPELLLSYGDAHADGVWVYTYDPQTDAVNEWGEFSSFGDISYFERQGIIVSQYGAMGFWHHIFEQVGIDGVKQVLAVEGIDASKGNVMRYFWQAPCEMTSWETGREDFNFDKAEVSVEKQVEEYNAFLDGLADEVDVAYRDMIPFSVKEIYAAYREYTGDVSCD